MRKIFQFFKLQRYMGWIIFLVVFANLADAHEIHLKSGRIIKTKTVWEKDGMIMYETKGGIIGISKELVREIVYDTPTQPPALAKGQEGLIAYYLFNGNANDTIKPQNNGVVHGARLVADKFETLNSAYRFDGSDDYIQMKTPVLERPPFSVSFWFNLYAIKPEGQYLISNGGQAGAPQGFYCKLVGKNEASHARTSWPKSGIQCGVSNADPGFFGVVTKEALSLNEWHHVVCTWDGTPDVRHIFLYLDGKMVPVLTETRDREVYDGPNNMRIGAPNDNNKTGLFKGKIDDIRFYNRVLSAKEIQQLSQYTRKQSSPYIFDYSDDE